MLFETDFTDVTRVTNLEYLSLDFSIPDPARPGVLSQTESSPQRPEAPKSAHQRKRRTQTG